MRLTSLGSPRALWNSASTAGGSNRGISQPRAQAVGEVIVEFAAVQSGEVVTHDETLAQRFVHGHGESASQLGQADQQQAQALLGVHDEVGEEPEVFEDVVSQVVRFVDDEHGQLLVSQARRVISVRMAR